MIAEPIFLFDEFAEFLTSLSPRKVLAYKSSERSQKRVAFLLEKNRTAGLTPEESREMERFMFIEHIVQLARAKALLQMAAK